MNKKKKIANKKHRKTKARLKALKVSSLAKIKRKSAPKPVEKKVETAAVDVEKKLTTKKTAAKKTAIKKTAIKKTAVKKTAVKKTTAKKTTAKKD